MIRTWLIGISVIARNRGLLESAMFVAYLTVATTLLGRLGSASVAAQSVEEHPSLQVLSTFTVPITVFSASCTDECVSVPIFCTTRNAAATTRAIVVDALEVEKIYHELDCEPDGI